jgi:ATP-binding cassette subfamily F protein uup
MRSELEWVRKMPRARGTKSKSRLQAFDVLKEQATRKFDHGQVAIDIQTSRLGGKVIEARNLTKNFGAKKIVEHFNYSIKAGDRIGIVGPNGIGKSTFIDLLTKRSEPDAGKVTIGDTVVLGVFGQQGLILEEDKRIIEVVRDIADVIPMSKGRTLTAAQLLERFLFDKEKQYQYVSTLSGGERRRLHLCTVLMKNPNVLVLDEPTNDLDIPTLNALEDFLTDLGICLLIVSHDRFFMDKICTKLLVFEGEGIIKEWVLSYTELREHQKEQERTAKEVRSAKGAKEEQPIQPPLEPHERLPDPRNVAEFLGGIGDGLVLELEDGGQLLGVRVPRTPVFHVLLQHEVQEGALFVVVVVEVGASLSARRRVPAWACCRRCRPARRTGRNAGRR